MTRRIAVLCIAALGLGAAPAQGAFDDPLTIFAPVGPGATPAIGFSDPCGLAVDAAGNFYVASYYNRAFYSYLPSLGFRSQLLNTASLQGPCGLAVDSTNRVYANNFHQGVFRYGASPVFGPGTGIDPGPATGIAVDPATNSLYVNRRDHLAIYDSSGAGAGTIGTGGNLLDAFGVAVSRHSLALGRIYVPDAGTDTVKIFDPLVSTTTPVATISGPPGGFNSLVDSAIAIDNVSGTVYVADQVGSRQSERPESIVYAFDATNAYKGHLKYNVIDGAPVGLAVDNSAGANQGRVYLTSGNGENGAVYIYPPGAPTFSAVLPVSFATPSTSGSSAKSTKGLGGSAESSSSPTAAASETSQKGNVLLDVNGDLSPQRLPRKGAAPISVSVGWQIATTDGAPPPKLKTLKIEINRAGRFDLEGLPTCPYAKIQPANTSRALANCREALVGRGSFQALIALAGQESYVASGQMLIFNGLQGKKPVLLAQIYSPRPFANSFVITFKLAEIDKGRYGSALTATLPPALRDWGSLTEIQMRLKRIFGYEGARHSFLSAGCPAPKGFTEAPFPLARTSFSFIGGYSQSLTLTRSCRVRG
ncbi:MAG TPA: hypothetical protein VGO66_12125 [Solirubrobacterales bacterium]|jgi:hypothetical protein|nr:hypothetical protein [Solirubrobacterales bacterium]